MIGLYMHYLHKLYRPSITKFAMQVQLTLCAITNIPQFDLLFEVTGVKMQKSDFESNTDAQKL